MNIETPRLLLREFRLEDWRAVHEYGADPQTVQYMPFGPNSEEETRQFVGRAILRAGDTPRFQYELAVILRATKQLIGGCGLSLTQADSRQAMLGYCFNRRAWGHGYATEAASAILEYSFNTLKLHRVYAVCDPDNSGSWRVMEKVGMRPEAHFRASAWYKGRWHDELLYAILEQEWREGPFSRH